jgi:hypothetical protein
MAIAQKPGIRRDILPPEDSLLDVAKSHIGGVWGFTREQFSDVNATMRGKWIKTGLIGVGLGLTAIAPAAFIIGAPAYAAVSATGAVVSTGLGILVG